MAQASQKVPAMQEYQFLWEKRVLRYLRSWALSNGKQMGNPARLPQTCASSSRKENSHYVMRSGSQVEPSWGWSKLVLKSLSPATCAEQSGLLAETRSRDSQAAQCACQGTPKCHIQLLTLCSAGGTGEWGVKCWVSTNVTAKGLQES